MQDEDSNDKRKSKELTSIDKARIFAACAIFLAIIGVILISHSISNSGAAVSSATTVSEKTKGKAAFSADPADTQYAVVNPASLKVSGRITNTGNAPGKPTCSVDAHDDARSYTGVDSVYSDKTLNPGEVWYFSDDLTITHQGAQYITTVDIKC